VKLNSVWKWWGHRRIGLCKKFVAEGAEIRPLPYDDLSDDKQAVVYHYWMFGEILKKELERK